MGCDCKEYRSSSQASRNWSILSLRRPGFVILGYSPPFTFDVSSAFYKRSHSWLTRTPTQTGSDITKSPGLLYSFHIGPTLFPMSVVTENPHAKHCTDADEEIMHPACRYELSQEFEVWGGMKQERVKREVFKGDSWFSIDLVFEVSG